MLFILYLANQSQNWLIFKQSDKVGKQVGKAKTQTMIKETE